MIEYNLSIACVDGGIYGFIHHDTNRLWNFLKEYDHEGSSVSLVRRDASGFHEIPYDDIYDELRPEGGHN